MEFIYNGIEKINVMDKIKIYGFNREVKIQ